MTRKARSIGELMADHLKEMNKLSKEQAERLQPLVESIAEEARITEANRPIQERLMALGDARLAALQSGDVAESRRIGHEMEALMAQLKR